MDGQGRRLSVVTVTYNSRDAVLRCLEALVPQLRDGDEVVVVDNASTDGTPVVVRDRGLPGVRVIDAGGNLGFAAGCRAGAAAAQGDVLLFLNPDCLPADGFVEAIVGGADAWDAWMGLVTMQDGAQINTDGTVVHFTGLAWAGHVGDPVQAAPPGPRPVPALSGACLAVHREVWKRADGFSPAYFMYHEDVDFSVRVRLAGGRLGIEPRARVDHDYDFVRAPAKWRMLERNRWATVIRTYPAALLILVLPALLVTEAALLLVAARGGWLAQKLLAVVDLLGWAPRLVAERRTIQRRRGIGARTFAAGLTAELSSPYLGSLGRSPAVRVAVVGYWRAVLGVLAAVDRVSRR